LSEILREYVLKKGSDDRQTVRLRYSEAYGIPEPVGLDLRKYSG